MATYDEVYAWASAGKSHCAYMWMLHSQHPDKVFKAYPMYRLYTNGGCGRANIKDIPRIEYGSSHEWDSTGKADCACAGIM